MTPGEMKADWLAFILARDPAMKDTSEYTVNAMLAEAVAAQFWTYVQLMKQKVLDSNPRTATGAALSALVLDRLPEGRFTGERATGDVAFSRPSASTVSYVIPAGTIVATDGEGGTVVKFETTEEVTLAAGQVAVYAHARAINIGIASNVPAHTIVSILTPVYGVNGVINELAFDYGTDGETDEDLRLRYIYALWENGAATKPMIEAHLAALQTIREVSVTTLSGGDMLVIADSSGGVHADPTEMAAIQEIIAANRAAGNTAPGVLGASLRAAGHTFELGDCSGGRVWFRARQYLPAPVTVPFVYIDLLGSEKTGTITLPAGTAEGQAVEATLSDPDDLATLIKSSVYAGTAEFDIFMALGDYPDCWIAPELRGVDVVSEVVLADYAEVGLLDSIKASVSARIAAYRVGETIHHADIYRCFYADYTVDPARVFVGVHDVPTLAVTCKGITLDFGEHLDIDLDERAEPGDLDGIIAA